LCRRCRLLTGICSRCDRGNIYCGKACSAAARKASQRRSAERYQKSERGRALHAARQQRYLERREAKMTHHGSPTSLVATAFRMSRTLTVRTQGADDATTTTLVPSSTPLCCAVCRRPLPPFARTDFRRRR